jgi:spoIIIJ-associated protein
MKVVEIEGKNVEDAKKKASDLYNLDSENLQIDIIDEGKSGIFGLGTSRPAKIRIYYNDLTENTAEHVREFLDNLLKKMQFDGSVYEIKEGKSKVYVELRSNEAASLIIGKRGKTLEAIQLLANLSVSHVNGSSKRIIIDIENYRRKREMALARLAKMTASSVLKSGRSRLLEPMNPFERRLIHLSLQNDNRVNTYSEGNGIYKRVRIEKRSS